jgi:hypothetical protein
MTSANSSTKAITTLTMKAEATVIANFAWQHMLAAITFRNHVEEIEKKYAGEPFGAFFEDIRTYGSACITSAAAALEALINELFIAPTEQLRPKIADFEKEFWGKKGIERKPALEKYQIALDMLGKPRLNEMSSPYVDAWALIEMRNALIHYKPTWEPYRGQKAKAATWLSEKYALSAFPDQGADFVTMRSMSGGCMRWVLSSVFAYLREFDARACMNAKKMGAFWGLSIR